MHANTRSYHIPKVNMNIAGTLAAARGVRTGMGEMRSCQRNKWKQTLLSTDARRRTNGIKIKQIELSVQLQIDVFRCRLLPLSSQGRYV